MGAGTLAFCIILFILVVLFGFVYWTYRQLDCHEEEEVITPTPKHTGNEEAKKRAYQAAYDCRKRQRAREPDWIETVHTGYTNHSYLHPGPSNYSSNNCSSGSSEGGGSYSSCSSSSSSSSSCGD